MPQPDALFLEHMLQALNRIEELLVQTTRDEFDGDWVVQDALIRELEIVGEAAGRVSSDLAQSHPEIPWKEITGLRHKLIHDYFTVDLGIVWRTAAHEAAEVRPLIEKALEALRRWESLSRFRSPGNARFPRGPSVLAFALDLSGSILNTTGPALRDLAGR
jgi:uncharacterized protein with HEPN domain